MDTLSTPMKTALVIFCLLDPQPGAVETVKADLENFGGRDSTVVLPPDQQQTLQKAITDLESYALFSVKDDVTKEMVASYVEEILKQRQSSYGGTALSNIHILAEPDAVNVLAQSALRGECQLGNL
ncbi:MAG: hypothetical protein ACAI35_23910 [Candidatus Methylacidiphilales bacterium]|nr:hypothetical protein [Candidatus Methylacidiphilales bacterium]